MNIRHLVTKSFDDGNKIRDSLIVEGVPFNFNITSIDEISEFNATEEKSYEVDVNFSDSYPPEINLSKELISGRDTIKSCPFGDIICDSDNNIKPLSQLFDYKVREDSELINALPKDTPFGILFQSDAMKTFMSKVCAEMFPFENPLTKKKDFDVDAYYTPYIPLVVLTGGLVPQISDDDKVIFNADGTVSVAEFLDSLNAINNGVNSNVARKRTLDNISDENDYFNEGYQQCLRGISSPFYNLYTREELMNPITRFELSYITVICWSRFIEKFSNVYSNPYYLGINFDWEHPLKNIQKFKDGFDYKISKIITNKQYNILSLNIKDYKGKKSMTEYKQAIKDGKSAIPLPVFMSMLELDVINLFNFVDDIHNDKEEFYLNPVREVSRGELCYFLTMLASIFTTKYIYQ